MVETGTNPDAVGTGPGAGGGRSPKRSSDTMRAAWIGAAGAIAAALVAGVVALQAGAVEVSVSGDDDSQTITSLRDRVSTLEDENETLTQDKERLEQENENLLSDGSSGETDDSEAGSSPNDVAGTYSTGFDESNMRVHSVQCKSIDSGPGVDLDIPTTAPEDEAGVDLYFWNCGGPGHFAFPGDVSASEAPASATAEQCADAIRLGAFSPEFTVEAAAGQSFCLITDEAPHHIVRFDVVDVEPELSEERFVTTINAVGWQED